MGNVTFGIPRDLTLALARAQNCTAFVETGTFRGETTRWAADHFETVDTIELSETLYERHHRDLEALGHVTTHLGDSAAVLPKILERLASRRALLWLDGHWCFGETAGAGRECVLLEELATLADRPDDVVLIDDARLFLHAPPRPFVADQWPTIPELARLLTSPGCERFVQVIHDVIIAVPAASPAREVLLEHARDVAGTRDLPSRTRRTLRTIRRLARRMLP